MPKPYGSTEKVPYPAGDLGWQPNPPIVSIVGEKVKIVPSSFSQMGYTYAVFVTGNVNVNSTIQQPVSTYYPQFDIHLPFNSTLRINNPPELSN